tara:strand:- start:103 stop:783 length:681 start_codon:yes stop_codon:yes gene_type:complete
MSKSSTQSKNDNASLVHDYGLCINNREIYLHSYIGESEDEPGVDYRMAVRFQKNINILNRIAQEPILIHMHTIGGSWHDGMGIYDAIKLSPCQVTILCYGSVSSMSSVILQSADIRIMLPNTEFMIHYGSMGVDANSISVKSAVDQNEKLNKIMLDIYASSCYGSQKFDGYSIDRIKRFLDSRMRQKQELYLDSRECVEYGFADAVLGDEDYETIQSILPKKCIQN